MSRTIADLAGDDHIATQHLADGWGENGWWMPGGATGGPFYYNPGSNKSDNEFVIARL